MSSLFNDSYEYLEGYYEGIANGSMLRNPYKHKSAEWELWQIGFTDGRRKMGTNT